MQGLSFTAPAWIDHLATLLSYEVPILQQLVFSLLHPTHLPACSGQRPEHHRSECGGKWLIGVELAQPVQLSRKYKY